MVHISLQMNKKSLITQRQSENTEKPRGRLKHLPRNQLVRHLMVKFEVTGESLWARSLLESLAGAAGTPGSSQASSTRLKIKISAKALFAEMPAKQGNSHITMTYTNNTGAIAIQCSAALEDQVLENMIELEALYSLSIRSKTRIDLENPQWQTPGGMALRFPPHAEAQGGPPEKEKFPSDVKYHEALQAVALLAATNLQAFPIQRERLLEWMTQELGLQEADEHDLTKAWAEVMLDTL
jgi:hypothetical protein